MRQPLNTGPAGWGRPRRPCTSFRTRPCRARFRVRLSDPLASCTSSYDHAFTGCPGLEQFGISPPVTPPQSQYRQRIARICWAAPVQHKTAFPTCARNTSSDVRLFTASSGGSPSDPSSCRRPPGQSEPRSFPEPLSAKDSRDRWGSRTQT